jgi:ferredoxin
MYVGIERRGCLRCYQCFTLFDIFLFEKELTVEIREVDCVEIQEGDVAEAGQNYVFYCERLGLALARVGVSQQVIKWQR